MFCELQVSREQLHIICLLRHVPITPSEASFHPCYPPFAHLHLSPAPFPSGSHHTVVCKASCFYYFVSVYEARLLQSDRQPVGSLDEPRGSPSGDLAQQEVPQELHPILVLGFSLEQLAFKNRFLMPAWRSSHLQSPGSSDLICLLPTPLKICSARELGCTSQSTPMRHPAMPNPCPSHRIGVWGLWAFCWPQV